MNGTSAMDLTSAISSAVSSVQTQLTNVAPEAIGIGVGIFVLLFGWKLVKRLSK